MEHKLVRLRSRFHFITTSCYRRASLFDLDEAKDEFLVSLESVRRRYEFVVVGYVVMPEHVHLLIGEPNFCGVAKVMQSLKQRVSRAVSQMIGGPFWQTRYYDFNVFSEKKRLEKLRYIHRNPVARRLVGAPEDWKWSSYRHYALGEVGVVKVAVPVRAREYDNYRELF